MKTVMPPRNTPATEGSEAGGVKASQVGMKTTELAHLGLPRPENWKVEKASPASTKSPGTARPTIVFMRNSIIINLRHGRRGVNERGERVSLPPVSVPHDETLVEGAVVRLEIDF